MGPRGEKAGYVPAAETTTDWQKPFNELKPGDEGFIRQEDIVEETIEGDKTYIKAAKGTIITGEKILKNNTRIRKDSKGAYKK